MNGAAHRESTDMSNQTCLDQCLFVNSLVGIVAFSILGLIVIGVLGLLIYLRVKS